MSRQGIKRLVEKTRSLKAKDLSRLKVSRATVYRTLSELVEEGEVVRVSKGRYKISDEADSDSWVMAQQQYPSGVLCLLTALAYHNLTTQSPREVWMALPKSAWRKATTYPPIRITHFSGKAFTAGVETHKRGTESIRVYSITKTIADCFKFRNQIGLDVALEALREGWRARKFTLEDLDAMAKVCRVQAVMRPYVEAMTA
jgi:predicted transcriptional regulator of viral defense system